MPFWSLNYSSTVIINRLSVKLTVPLILASSSPRRKHLLEAMGFDFKIFPANISELEKDGESPRELAERLATEKSLFVASQHPGSLTIGADTIVVLDEKVLGKPRDSIEAVSMLTALSGRSHEVITAISLVHASSRTTVTTSETTVVYFDTLSQQQIVDYVASGSPMDKAGAYGIQDDQGAFLVHRIEGDYYTVVGLPLHRLSKILATQFAHLVG